MLNIGIVFGRLRRSRHGVVGPIVAIALPAILLTAALATEAAFIGVRESQLQAAADAGAGGGRQVYDSFVSGPQSAAVAEAQRLANGNMASSLAAADVKQGWWDIKTKTFGSPVPGQTGGQFSNAIEVTTRLTHPLAFASLLGRGSVALSRKAIGYKCSNNDYPLTLIPDDVPAPDGPSIYLSWASPGHPDPKTSYYYQQPDGRRNPIFKFYSDTDNENVSFVVSFSDNSRLQVDTYCKGTYLVIPDAFDWKNKDPRTPITATILRGSTNNSFDTYPDAEQGQYPLVTKTGVFYTDPAKQVANPYLDLTKVRVTRYPTRDNGYQNWASEGNPTPDRRTVLVK